MTNEKTTDSAASALSAGLCMAAHGVRIFLLRLIIGWWMVPFMWTFGWLLSWLLFGARAANEMAIDMTKAVWFGDA